MTTTNENLKQAIDEVEAANPAPEAEAVDKQEVETPAEQGNEAATGSESEQEGEQEESEGSATSDGNDAPAHRQNKGVGKRINELTREKYEAIRRAEAAERRLQEVEQAKPKAPTQQESSDGRPKLEDFDFDADAHAEAVADWKVRKVLAEERTDAAKRQSEEAFQDRLKAVDPVEWQAAITAPVNYTPAMLEVIKDAEMGPQVAVYLAKNLDEADQISRMSDFHAAAAIGRIEAKLAAPASAASPSPPKTVTKAPAPAPTVNGTAVAKKEVRSMSVEDHLAVIRAKPKR